MGQRQVQHWYAPCNLNRVWCHFLVTFSEGREWGVGSVVVGSVFGAPQIFAPNRSETLQDEGFGASGLKIGVPQKRRLNDHGSNAPFSAL